MSKNIKSYKTNLEYLSDLLDYLMSLTTQRIIESKLTEYKSSVVTNDVANKNKKSDNKEEKENEDEVDTRALKKKLGKAKRSVETNLKKHNQRTRLTLKEGSLELPLESIKKQYKLNQFEKMVIAVLLCHEIDDSFRQHSTKLDENPYYSCITEIRGVLNFLCKNISEKVKARKYFVHKSRLLKNGLINLSYQYDRSETSFMTMDLEIPRKIVSQILGEYDIDDQLVSFSSIITPKVNIKNVVLPDQKKTDVLNMIAKRNQYLAKRSQWGFDEILPYGKGTIILFSGPSGTGKTMLAHALANHNNYRLMLVDIRKIIRHSGYSFEQNLECVFHEAKLQNAIIFFDEADEMFADRKYNNAMHTLLREIEKLDGICIMATNRKKLIDEAFERRITYKLDFELPTPELREEIWKLHLPAEAPLSKNVNLKELAEEFDFSGGFIKNAVLIALNKAITRSDDNAFITQEDLRHGAILQRNNKLESYTDKVQPKISLSDVVLPDDIMAQVKNFVAAAKKRNIVFSSWGFGEKMNLGKALSVIFVGPSGVGKTLTAEAIAYELGQNLYPVCLPNIISKYVGDTEENIKQVFDSAKESQSILFFDEADSLFGSRVDGGSYHSHYINSQVNTLLQEIEKFNGIVILATNLPDSIDKAFERRIRYKIYFKKPDICQRENIWKKMIPENAPLDKNIDFNFLAREYNFSGGNIKNVILRAAFEAATNGQVITNKILINCADNELPLSANKRLGFRS